MENIIHSTYAIETADFADLVCRDCAIDFATEHNLTWNRPATYDFTETVDDEDSLAAYEDVFGQLESDTPQACDCGAWLDTRLTRDGIQYLTDEKDNYPGFVVKFHLGEEG